MNINKNNYLNYKNHIIEFIKNNLLYLIFPILGFLLGFYYQSPLSLYFWNPLLEFLFNFLFLPLKWFPNNFYVLSGGFIPVPNYPGILLALITTFVFQWIFAIILSNLFKIIFQKKIIIITAFCFFVFFISYIGSIITQDICVKNIEKKGKFENIPILYIVFHSNKLLPLKPFSNSQLNSFYKSNGLDYIDGNATSLPQSSFVKVKLNETSKKICRLNYNKVFAVRPIRREEMYRKDMYGKIINFCKKIKDRNEKNGCFKDLNLSSCLDDWCELAD